MVTEKTKAMRTRPKGIHSFGKDDDVVNEAADLGWVVSSDGDEATTPEAAEAWQRWRTWEGSRQRCASPGAGRGLPGSGRGVAGRRSHATARGGRGVLSPPALPAVAGTLL